MMTNYVRTNAEGDRVFDLAELDMAALANLYREIDMLASEIDVDFDFGDPDNGTYDGEVIDMYAMEAIAASLPDCDEDGHDVAIDEDTRIELAERVAQALAKRYGVTLPDGIQD